MVLTSCSVQGLEESVQQCRVLPTPHSWKGKAEQQEYTGLFQSLFSRFQFPGKTLQYL